MPQRVIKIILPQGQRKQALELLESQDKLSFWQEESSGGNFVARFLVQGVSPRAWWEADKAKEATRKAGCSDFSGNCQP